MFNGSRSGNWLAIWAEEFNIFCGSSMPMGYRRGEGGVWKKNFFISDRLGSLRCTLSDTGAVLAGNDFLPFGKEILANNNRLAYIGKERDKESSLADHGVRKYDAEIGRFTSYDALWGKYISLTPYQYSANNPISFVDLNGKEVEIVFSKGSNRLLVEDLDNHIDGLPYEFVTYDQYLYNGIRDENGSITKNQILVIEGVFSGGEADNDCSINNKYIGANIPIPNGIYDLTEYETNRTWYKLDARDNSRFDDETTLPGGQTRNGFRLHLGSISHGCITVCNKKEESSKAYNVLQNIISFTSSYKVPKREGSQKYIPLFYSFRDLYGKVIVID